MAGTEGRRFGKGKRTATLIETVWRLLDRRGAAETPREHSGSPVTV